MKSKVLLRTLILTLYVSLLFFLAEGLSLSFYEVDNFFDKDSSILYYPLNALTAIFGQTDSVLRAFMVFLHLVSLLIFFKVSKPYLENERDRLWNMILFVLLPSIVSSAIIVHPSGLILLMVLFFLYGFQKYKEKALWVLVAYAFVSLSFFILFFGLSVYFLSRKQYGYFVYQLILMGISIALFGFLGHGLPANYFMHRFGVSSLVFSPLLFIYYLYTLLRVGFRGHKDMIWTLSASAFILMLILSLRQRVAMEHFAPYLIILLPLMVKQFMHAYRIRVRRLRKSYKILFSIALLFLILNSLSVYFNKYWFLVIENPKKHFLYQHYIAKDLAKILKDTNNTELDIKDKSLAKRLSFYGVKDSSSSLRFLNTDCKNVTISYEGREIAYFCVSKKNTNGNK